MNSAEIIRANLAHSGASRPGLNFDRERRNDLVWGGPGNPVGYEQKRWKEGNVEYYDDIWGNLWHRFTDGCAKGEIFRPAIEDWAQMAELRAPSYDEDMTIASFRSGFAAHPDRFKLAGMPGWVFADARYLRKMEVYLMDMALYPEELHRLHRKIAALYEKIIVAAGKAGADGICFAEDLGTQRDVLFSPEMWQEYFGELYAGLFARAHEYGMSVWMHSCGQNRKLLEPLLKAGVNCFQFDQPAVYDYDDLAALLRRYRAVLWSPVDIQKIMPTGDRTLIEQGAEEMFRAFHGFLICKNYPDLPGIGVKEEWDDWAYRKIMSLAGLE